jgi:hypothetical protein
MSLLSRISGFLKKTTPPSVKTEKGFGIDPETLNKSEAFQGRKIDQGKRQSSDLSAGNVLTKESAWSLFKAKVLSLFTRKTTTEATQPEGKPEVSKGTPPEPLPKPDNLSFPSLEGTSTVSKPKGAQFGVNPLGNNGRDELKQAVEKRNPDQPNP